MAKHTKRRRISRKPDDYFASGPYEFARFGKITVARSRASPEQAAAMQARMAERFPIVVAEVDALVSSIAGQIARLPPAQLLHRAWWEFATIASGVGNKKARDSGLLAAMRMVDYVQSLIVSVQPMTYAEEVSEESWNRLKADVTNLFDLLTLQYQLCKTAHRQAKVPNLDMDLEEFRVRAETLWLNIRGKRYHVHERQALLEALATHSDILVTLFGIDAAAMADELDKVLTKRTHGLAESTKELLALRDDSLARFDTIAGNDAGADPKDIFRKVFEDKGLAERREKVFGDVFGMDLFDVGKNTALPQHLLDELSWSPGEEAEFFAAGDFRGWPLRIWPIMKRPFIRLDDRVFCFDIFSLFDNIYRVLRRMIVRRKPTYVGVWNDRQKAMSEKLPFTYFQRLLPGSRVCRPVYYRWAVGGRSAQWYESDGLLIFDGHLLVIEVKAGAFTYTSPANDLPAHFESLRALLQAPAHQGSRFVDYLESAAQVPIADADHNEIGQLRRSDFQHVTVCAITLDAFTALAARAQRLEPLGIDVGKRPVWSLSIDDLRVYAELFDNPLIFLHFIEQRMRAAQSKYVDLNDEMDHLGLYVTQNNYSKYAADLMISEFDRLGFDGFTTPIDDYFYAMLRGDTPNPLRQRMHKRLAQVVDFLARSNEPRRSELASFLLDAAGDFRDTFAAAIDQALRENDQLHRVRPISFYGAMAMTLYVWSPPAPRFSHSAEDHTRTVLVINDETTRRLVEF